MAKQTMGISSHNGTFRFDNKVYRLTTPQLPLVKPELYEEFGFAEFPSGTNAVVAVISYTGYDMEDAMIINKSAYERGFGHGSVYKSVRFDPN
jgi:DNA-directed RNA polymerase I subunit RPA2